MRNRKDWDETYLESCRTLDQYCRTARAMETGRCNFCNATRHWAKAEFFRSEHVFGGENLFPIKYSESHLLVFPLPRPGKKHPVLLRDFDDEQWRDIRYACIAGEDKYNLPGGALLGRLGDPLYHRGTIEHWHLNYIVPDLATGKEVRPPIAKKREELVEDTLRAARFHHFYRLLVDAGRIDAWLDGVSFSDVPAGNWEGREDWHGKH